MANELFVHVNRNIGGMLEDVATGRIGLPDLQRPFVWQDVKVRDLLDSMLKGFPIGYVLLWESPSDFENKSQIGGNDKNYSAPKDLVIDGQQRLTALLAAIKGIKIKDSKYRERNIRIAFNLLTRQFQVWSQAYARSSEWISNISDAFKAASDHMDYEFRGEYMDNLSQFREANNLDPLSNEERKTIERNFSDLLGLENYLMPTLEIKSFASEEAVADIFVRVNSGGQKLTEKNFIETLLSVYDNDMHKHINQFAKDSRIPVTGTSFNQIMEVDPVHLIRAAVGIAFNRARLKYAYMLLRGRDLETQKYSPETQQQNLTKFREAMAVVTDLNHWHAFLNLVADAGYMSKTLISSSNGIIFSYMLYLKGKTQYEMPVLPLKQLMQRWIFMSAITGYFTDNTESTVERLLADMRKATRWQEYAAVLDAEIKNIFTNDYFSTTLPSDLVTSSTTSPLWYGYIASLNILNHPLLFSTTPTSKYFLPGASGTKNAIDIHHIFPKSHLEKIGITEDRYRNQIANYTCLDYQTNIDISDDPPADYVARFRAKLGEDGYRTTCEQNALPENFENLEYEDFLNQRRRLMAQLIRKAYNKLCE